MLTPRSDDAGAKGGDGQPLEVTVASLALRFAGLVGPRLRDPILDRLAGTFARRHPRAAEALSALPEGTILIDPADLPHGLLMRVGPGGLRLRLCAKADAEAAADAVVRGRFGALLDLVEGRIDGDALFFRRDLTIAGDTALVVALRNTLDGEDLDLLAELDAAAGPLGRLGPKARQHASRIGDALRGVRAVLLQPAVQRLDALERRLARIESSGTKGR